MEIRQTRELQVSSSQLALIFLAILAVAIVIFILGVSVGKKYGEAQLEAGKEKVMALPEAKTLSGETPLEKKPEPSLVTEKMTVLEHRPSQVQKVESEQTKPPEIPLVKKAERAEKIEAKPPAKVTPEAKIAKPSLKVYFVQIGAFSRKEASTSLVQELKKAGYQTVVLDPLPTDRTPLYRIRVGPFTSESEAEAAKNRVRTLIPAASKAFIVRQ